MSHADPEARRAYLREYHAKNKPLTSAADKAKRSARVCAWNKANPDKVKNWTLLRLYGITLAQCRALLRGQRFRCGLCRSKLTSGYSGWRVDHDHATRKVRGILCHSCNVGLGHFRDSPLLLEKAAQYLRKHKK